MRSWLFSYKFVIWNVYSNVLVMEMKNLRFHEFSEFINIISILASICFSKRNRIGMWIVIHPSRKKALASQRKEPYFIAIEDALKTKMQAGETIYPPADLVFNAFNLTPLDDVKVVVLGQDPYHGAGQAHGLSFSVPDEVKIPPSLRNIYKEIVSEYGGETPVLWNLERWARQWVLLLNSFLTVTASQAWSHQWIGRGQFTDHVIQTVSAHQEHVVFMLWWKFAQSKESLIDTNKHCVLTSSHPSPFSAYRWFLGNGHFKTTNEYLEFHGKQGIQWIN